MIKKRKRVQAGHEQAAVLQGESRGLPRPVAALIAPDAAFPSLGQVGSQGGEGLADLAECSRTWAGPTAVSGGHPRASFPVESPFSSIGTALSGARRLALRPPCDASACPALQLMHAGWGGAETPGLRSLRAYCPKTGQPRRMYSNEVGPGGRPHHGLRGSRSWWSWPTFSGHTACPLCTPGPPLSRAGSQALCSTSRGSWHKCP